MKLNSLPVLILLLIVAVAWVGFSIYFNSTELDIDPNATSYMQNINPVFDERGLDDVMERSENSLPISPDEFLNAVNPTDSNNN